VASSHSRLVYFSLLGVKISPAYKSSSKVSWTWYSGRFSAEFAYLTGTNSAQEEWSFFTSVDILQNLDIVKLFKDIQLAIILGTHVVLVRRFEIQRR